MKITTAYPVYVNNKRVAGSNDWLYVEETPTTATTPTPTPTQVQEMGKKGLQWDKIKGWVQKGKELGQQFGVLDWVKNQLNLGVKPKGRPAPAPVPVSTKPPAKEGGISTKTILMIGGGVVVAGLLVWGISKMGKGTTTTKA